MTKFEKMQEVIEILANDFTPEERVALQKMDFNSFKGLTGKQLKSRISKSKLPWIVGPDTFPFA